jgi:hypothetical protein
MIERSGPPALRGRRRPAKEMRMTERERPMLRLRLHGGPFEPGEPPLGDLARLGEDTQAVARCFGRMVAGRPGLTRLSAAVPSATQLKLVGLEAVGDATVLDLAGVDAPAGGLLGDALPLDLGARALFAFVDSLTALTEELPDLPDGFDDETRYGLDIWLRRVRRFGRVVVSVSFGATARGCELEPVAARERLALLDVPPHESLVPATRHAIEGVLYALNLHTGTYAVEDDHGQRIRLTVPAELRAASASLISSRIRAEGEATIDDQGRLHLLSVAGLAPARTFEQPGLVGLPNGPAAATGVIAGGADDDAVALAQLTRQAEAAARRLAELGQR